MAEHRQVIMREDLERSLPPPTGVSITDLAALHRRVNRQVIVLDDDPTGTQTVHDVPVITRWEYEDLVQALNEPAGVVYVLTNSRALEREAARALNRDIAVALRQAAEAARRDFVVVSRSDSTLRGHFPDEMDVLESELGQSFDGWILCPYFAEGGRLTVGDTHYVAEGDQLVPCAQTPFAQDAAFGYTHSHLPQWVEEKSNGRIAADQVMSLTLEELRSNRPEQLVRKIESMGAGQVCLINALVEADLHVAVAALLEAEAQGRRFLYRTAASFVAARGAIERRPLLDADELHCNDGCGVLVVVGSHVPKSTAQLAHLREHLQPKSWELDVRLVLDESARETHVRAVAREVAGELARDGVAVVYTSRELQSHGAAESLLVGRRVSKALVSLVEQLGARPRALVGKGGITASDLATDACHVQRAVVMGQVLPGIPVWRCGRESRYPGMPLIVFPGNVGDVDALSRIVAMLRADTDK